MNLWKYNNIVLNAFILDYFFKIFIEGPLKHTKDLQHVQKFNLP